VAKPSHDHEAVGQISVGQARSASLALLALACFGALLAVAQDIPTNSKTSSALTTCSISPAMFNSFFQSGIATPNGVALPANSVTFSNDTGKHNCDFYQWAQQMFLWLTSPAPASYGGGGGRIFASPQFFTVSPADSSGKRTLISNSAHGILQLNLRAAQVGAHGLPVIMSKSGQMFEVQPGPVSKAGKPLILNRLSKQVEVANIKIEEGKAVLLDKAGKAVLNPKLIVSEQIPHAQLRALKPQQEELAQPIPRLQVTTALSRAQAQMQKLTPAPVNPNLIAQKFTLNGKTIFLNVNGGVIDTEEGQADDSVLLAQNGSLIYYVSMVNDVFAFFITGTKDGGITPTPTQFPTTASDLAKITTFATAHGKTFPDPNALAIEVKSAWIETTGLTNLDQYITTEAVIPTYDKTNPNVWVPNGHKTTKLALIGMHVVGSAAGHAEMIWSTFEHFGNAPNATYAYTSTAGNTTVTQPSPIAGTWLFCATGSTGPFNQPKAKYQSPNIVGWNQATMTPGTTPIVPTDIIRFKPFGAAFGTTPNPLIASDLESNAQMIGIDQSVKQDFAGLPMADVRTNYYMTGATWTENGNPPSGNFPPGNAVGTSQLANTTMETFQQTNSSFSQFSNNCFSCHLTNQLNVSHMACDPTHGPGCVNGIQPLF
jgi:hypothetical protein